MGREIIYNSLSDEEQSAYAAAGRVRREERAAAQKSSREQDAAENADYELISCTTPLNAG